MKQDDLDSILEHLENSIYQTNSYISLQFIGLKKIPTEDELTTINQSLSKWIKEIRKIRME